MDEVGKLTPMSCSRFFMKGFSETDQRSMDTPIESETIR